MKTIKTKKELVLEYEAKLQNLNRLINDLQAENTSIRHRKNRMEDELNRESIKAATLQDKLNAIQSILTIGKYHGSYMQSINEKSPENV